VSDEVKNPLMEKIRNIQIAAKLAIEAIVKSGNNLETICLAASLSIQLRNASDELGEMVEKISQNNTVG
jgi:hypothetical protein